MNQSLKSCLGWWEPQLCRRHGWNWERICKQLYDSPYSMSLFVPECLEEVQTAGSHRHCDDLCLTHFSTAKGLSRGKKTRGKILLTFTCFIFLPPWVKMTFHFLPQVIWKGLIQFALQAVSNPAHTPLNVSLRRVEHCCLIIFYWQTWCISTQLLLSSEKKTVCQSWLLKYQWVSLTRCTHCWKKSKTQWICGYILHVFHMEGGA